MLVFFQAEDGIRDMGLTGVQTCALPILSSASIDSTLAYLLTAGVAVWWINVLAFTLFYWQIERSRPRLSQKNTNNILTYFRSEERRVGKERRSRWSPYH